ncbi:MAG TPA: (Fe-S)-binding protein, partial [Candidatus Marinimicrobia bacterium]|nr:(Fe-S)-binding protein [Candidatus Neomarinimicrobiota bacterium]
MADHKYESFIQKDNVIIDGIDISGEWNKMYEPREITEYDITFLEKVRDLPGAESMGWCYQCAQCVGVCPVENVGSYGPRKIYRKLQTGVNLFEHPDLWLCTTCSNCLRICPKEVDMMKIMPAARKVAVLDGNVPAELQEMLQNVAEYGNPMGESARKRVRWLRKFEEPLRDLSKEDDPQAVDVLWYVSDYFSYHGRGNDAAKSMVRVFNQLRVDFGILGKEEKCDGDSQRLVGESGLFEELAEHNGAQFDKYAHNKLVVSDPHAFNAFNKFYPAVTGKEYNVQHYTRFLAEQVDELFKLMKQPFPKKV